MKKSQYIPLIVIAFSSLMGIIFISVMLFGGSSSSKLAVSLPSETTESFRASSSSSSGIASQTSESKSSSSEISTEESQAETSHSSSVQETSTFSHQQAKHSEVGNKKYLLDIKQQVQRAWNTCAPTTVSMMLYSQGIEVSQEVLAEEMGTDTSFGTHNADAIRVLNRHLFGYETPQDNQAGYRLATVTTADPNSQQMRLFKERLKQNITDGYPMYYTFDSSKIYPDSHGEHNVIGVGYQLSEDGTDIAYLYYIDPSYTKQDPVYGGLKKITPEELFEAMLTCVEPNYAW